MLPWLRESLDQINLAIPTAVLHALLSLLGPDAWRPCCLSSMPCLFLDKGKHGLAAFLALLLLLDADLLSAGSRIVGPSSSTSTPAWPQVPTTGRAVYPMLHDGSLGCACEIPCLAAWLAMPAMPSHPSSTYEYPHRASFSARSFARMSACLSTSPSPSRRPAGFYSRPLCLLFIGS